MLGVGELPDTLVHRPPAGHALLRPLDHLGDPLLDVVLPRAVLDHHDAVPLALNHLGNVVKHDTRLEGNRLEQADVGRARGQHGVEAHAPAPQLADPDAVLHAARCEENLVDGLHGPLDDGVKANTLVDEGEVVLYGLWRHDDGQLHLARHRAHLDRVRVPARVHVAQEEQHVDTPLLEHREHLLDVAQVRRVPQDRAPLLVNVQHCLLRELQPVLGGLVVEAPPPEPHPPRALDVVAIVERVCDLPHDNVDAGVEPPAGDDGRVDLRRGEVGLLAGARADPLVVHQAFALRAH
mmetsp:Transcript_10356/g.26855  ORF Transcript_10356/g.26855 Transcript_10356/m.26855 type:complete len:294 (+) Transcript_10356:542-1423(+)